MYLQSLNRLHHKDKTRKRIHLKLRALKNSLRHIKSFFTI